jgi:hypothetical protein
VSLLMAAPLAAAILVLVEQLWPGDGTAPDSCVGP